MSGDKLNLDYEPKVLIETEGLTEEEWLSWRRRGIGGSDAAAVMGQSPFCTKRDLFYDKCGIQPVLDEEESNWVAKEVGHRLEDLVAEIFSRKTGLKVFPVRKMFQHPLYPFMVADVDYFIELADGTIGILECKTTNYNCQDKWVNNSVPVNYEYQGRHYLSVTNLNVAYFACLYGNNENEFIIRRMERDLDMEADLIAEEEYFWTENVQKQEEPPYTEKPDLVLESIRRFCGPAEADREMLILKSIHAKEIQRYLELKEKKSVMDAESKRLETEMKSAYCGVVEEMGANCIAKVKTSTEEYVITYKPAYRTAIDRKNLEKLKINHPIIYDDYVTVTESRRFSIKKGAL